MKTYATEQEKFWSEGFGNQYIDRNNNQSLISSNLALWSEILSCTCGIKSVIEFGANIGLNLKAIHTLMPHIELSGIEINQKAAEQLKEIANGNIHVYQSSILDWKPNRTWDCVFTKVVLIHINPEYLSTVYELIYHSAAKYICLVEYYSPTPTDINYRGYDKRLFKRDFAGEMLERFQDLELINYGFKYHRDYNFALDDINWFLLKKV